MLGVCWSVLSCDDIFTCESRTGVYCRHDKGDDEGAEARSNVTLSQDSSSSEVGCSCCGVEKNLFVAIAEDGKRSGTLEKDVLNAFVAESEG